MPMIPLDELIVYQRAMDLGDIVWNTVNDWDYFAKQTIGRQLVRSADVNSLTTPVVHCTNRKLGFASRRLDS